MEKLQFIPAEICFYDTIGIFWTTYLEAEEAGQQFLILGCIPQFFTH